MKITVADLAAQLAEALVTGKRHDGTEFVKLAEHAPNWMLGVCQAAHGVMMPDDWRYEFIQDCAEQLTHNQDDAPDAGDRYPYHADRCRWLASNLNRGGYCDEAVEEFGTDYPKGGIFEVLAWGMCREMEETFGLLKQHLEEHAESLEAEDADTEETDVVPAPLPVPSAAIVGCP